MATMTIQQAFDKAVGHHQSGHLRQAEHLYRQILAQQPIHAESLHLLGVLARQEGRNDIAVDLIRRAIALKPDWPEALINLGNVLCETGQLEQAIEASQRAIALRPDFPGTYVNLGNAFKENGQVEEAIASYRRAIALKPDYAEAHSNLVWTVHLHPQYDAAAIYREHLEWGRRHAEPLKKFIRPHANDRDRDRRLRVGYVSPDFRESPVGRYLLPLLANHDQTMFEIHAYADVAAADGMTQLLRSHTQVWRNISGLSDVQTADQIRHDRIDILVDLAMHTGHNRLLVFARKPAPVQVTYLTYCSTTGVGPIDYRLSDPYLDPIDSAQGKPIDSTQGDAPPGGDETVYSEKTIRLPETYWCDQPRHAPPECGPLPALGRGAVTFGSLNNFWKVSEPAIVTWGRLLRAAPNSRLLLHAPAGSNRRRVYEPMEREGIDPNRLLFVAKLPIEKYFDLYRQIDIALDSFPCGGGTTICDALWMGVPIVTLIGRTAVGRGGLSILSNVGVPELAALSQDAYIRIATELACDLPRLSELRSTLRRKMQQSPLMDAPRFARNIEAAYRRMWQAWCADGPSVASERRI